MKKDYFKITTFLLLGIILLAGLYWGYNTYSDSKFSQGALYGQTMTINAIMQKIGEEGSVNMHNGKVNVTLIPLEAIQITEKMAKEQVVTQIINQVEQQGSVELYNNQTKITLVSLK